jgi:hypothetical protein
MPSGAVMRTKYGSPTDSASPVTASASSGKVVPSSTTKARAPKTMLLARNAASRDTGDEILDGDPSRSARQAMRPMPVTATTARNPSSAGPIEDWLKAWTDSTTPDRVRNVPRIVRQNVATRSDRFHTRSIPRRSWTMSEWRKAVAVRHGRSEAFSTGSHAQ